jgi:hypothetical protein
MSETLWNIQDGFMEGFLRGLRSTFLTDADYSHLRDCRSIDGKAARCAWGELATNTIFAADLRLNLQETDYSDLFDESQAEVSAYIALT